MCYRAQVRRQFKLNHMADELQLLGDSERDTPDREIVSLPLADCLQPPANKYNINMLVKADGTGCAQ